MYQNGTPASGLPVTGRWQKSTYSTASHCVEANATTDGDVALRNSRDPNGPALVFTQPEWDAFLAGAKAGEFDRFACK